MMTQVLTNFEPVKLRSASKFFIPTMSKISHESKGKKKSGPRVTTSYETSFLACTDEKIFQMVSLISLVNVFDMLQSFIISMLK